MNSLRKIIDVTHLNFGTGFSKVSTDEHRSLLLSQIIELVDRKRLSRLVAKYGAEERVRHFKCQQQFICMVFAQMISRDGQHDIATCLKARPKTLYHLGFCEPVAKSTLAEANENRDWRIWENLPKSLIRKAKPLYAEEDFGIDLVNTIYALDSTTIDLSPPLLRKKTEDFKKEYGLNERTFEDKGHYLRRNPSSSVRMIADY